MLRATFGERLGLQTTSENTKACEDVLAGLGVNENYQMGLVRALSRPSWPVRRLLDLAKTWPDGPPVEVPEHPKYRTMRHLRPEELDQLVQAYQSGATVHELAAQFGINRFTVGEHLQRRGIDTKPSGLHPDDVPAAVKLYESGWSLLRIAEKFNTSGNTVRARLLEQGVRMRDPQGRER
jgi:DNA-binding CsgD family transcriptional regulator